MKNIYVITHTESIHHVEGKVGGWYDTGLTEKGKAQASKVAQAMVNIVGDGKPVITTSDLSRASETANIIGSALGCKCHTNPDLREKSYGIAEGKPQAWLEQRMVRAPDNNRLDHRIISGGETTAEFINRIYRAVEPLLMDDNQNHIVVSHGYALTFIVSRWIELPAASAGFVNFRGSAGGITHLQQDDYWGNRTVKQLNDTTHLK